ncbi:hypothetical protein AZI85_01400 [Bdellovibrio bacteriovorus]|uniref:Uncharacterized protein n=1 Tax=Bdellovibrio bacteriovorus TaxID=959 RepID=A0A150WW10_BDEBC|nr:hypothetical protein AZI85_01400 [Bdellovibrio bacteriovorus]
MNWRLLWKHIQNLLSSLAYLMLLATMSGKAGPSLNESNNGGGPTPLPLPQLNVMSESVAFTSLPCKIPKKKFIGAQEPIKK